MHLLDIITIVCIGLMVGTELTVSLFINPIIWQLDDQAQAKAFSLFGRYLGKAMPIWYILSLVLLIAEAYLRRHQPALTPLLTAIIIWVAVILYTVTTLVPINNRIVALSTQWRTEHKKWDTLHRWRILLITIAMICATHALLNSPVI
jgi:anthrone oxygenase-like protein